MSKYHNILGVPLNASPNQIKRAYHKLALKYHPDINKSPDAEAKFKEIKHAYEYLVTPRHTHIDYHREELAKQQQEELERKRREKLRKIKQRIEFIQRERQKAFISSLKQATFTLLAIIITLFVWNKKDDWAAYMATKKDYLLAEARVTHVGFRTVQYVFEVNGSSYSAQKRLGKSDDIMVMDDGMPAIIGAEYSVKYNPKKPNYNKIYYEKISPNTLEIYIQLTYNKIRNDDEFSFLYTDEDFYSFIKRIYGEYGVEGLAHLFFFNESFLENLSHNEMSFGFFKRKDGYIKIKRQFIQE